MIVWGFTNEKHCSDVNYLTGCSLLGSVGRLCVNTEDSGALAFQKFNKMTNEADSWDLQRQIATQQLQGPTLTRAK